MASGRRGGVVLVLALLLAVPAGASARLVTWGSSLTASPTQTVSGNWDGDVEFWNTALGPGRASGVKPVVAAPTSGRILKVKLKTGNDSRSVPLRFCVVQPLGGGRFKVLTSSTPTLNLPAHSPGIHTFALTPPHVKYGMPINKGDFLAIATPGVKPEASIWYGAVPGGSVDHFHAHAATQNPGFVWNGTAHPGLELLMQVVMRPGPSYHFHLP
jgi:hypothetical protein